MNKITKFLEKMWNLITNKKSFVENVVMTPELIMTPVIIPVPVAAPVIIAIPEKTKKITKKPVIQVKKTVVKKANKKRR